MHRCIVFTQADPDPEAKQSQQGCSVYYEAGVLNPPALCYVRQLGYPYLDLLLESILAVCTFRPCFLLTSVPRPPPLAIPWSSCLSSSLTVNCRLENATKPAASCLLGALFTLSRIWLHGSEIGTE